MDWSFLAGCCLLGVLLLLSALFSGTEMALLSLSKLQVRRLRQEHPRAGQLLNELLEQPVRLLSAILFGNTVINFAAATTGYVLLERLTPRHAEWLAVLTMTLLLLLVGELFPKALAMRNPESYARRVAGAAYGFVRATGPLRRRLEQIAEWIVALIVRLPYFAARAARAATLTAEEYRTVLTLSERAGIVRREERQMVNRILGLERMTVKEIMTPRVDMQCIDDSWSREEWIAAVRRIKHRRVPVVHGSPDFVEGILNVKAFLSNPTRELDEVIELPNFVPDTMSVAKLLRAFRKQEHPVAIVVDEYGGTQGLVTLEDILEEIVGEIEDEFDTSEIMIQRLDERRFLVNGKARLELVNEQCGVNLHAPAADTIAGWMIARLGTLPREGDQVVADNVRVTARRVMKNRLREVLLEREGR